jgi:hypothetical protein
MKLIVWQHRGRISCLSQNQNIEWCERKLQNYEQSKESITEESHLVVVEERR